MPAPSPFPEFVYKITPTAPPDPIPAAYPPSELDRADGFVHLSVSWQIPTTADLIFSDAAEIYIIKIRLSPVLAAATRWPDDLTGCAHLYADFGAADVEDSRVFRRGQEGKAAEKWSEVLKKEGDGWLVL